MEGRPLRLAVVPLLAALGAAAPGAAALAAAPPGAAALSAAAPGTAAALTAALAARPAAPRSRGGLGGHGVEIEAATALAVAEPPSGRRRLVGGGEGGGVLGLQPSHLGEVAGGCLHVDMGWEWEGGGGPGGGLGGEGPVSRW